MARRFHSHTPAKIATVIHTSSATAVGGRAGSVKNSDKVIDVKLSLPTGLGGSGVQKVRDLLVVLSFLLCCFILWFFKGTTTPEDLFAAGYAACFGGAAELMAKNLKIPATKISIQCDASVGRTDAKGLALGVVLTGHFSGVTQAQADQIMNAAHQACPYSNATRDNIEVRLQSKLNKD